MRKNFILSGPVALRPTWKGNLLMLVVALVEESARERPRYPSREFGTNSMYFYTTKLLAFLAVTGGLAAAIVLLLSGELIAHVFG